VGEPPPRGPPAPPAGVLTEPPLLGRKKELADVLRLLRDGGPITIVGPPGIGKTRFIHAVRAEAPGAVLRESEEALGEPGERVYRLKPLAEAPAVELYRVLSGDDDTPYPEVAERTRSAANVPGAIVELARRRRSGLRRLLRR
jgi:hypothetical protein